MVSPARGSRGSVWGLLAVWGACSGAFLGACGHPSTASFVPTLELGFRLRRRADIDRVVLHDTAQQWDTVALASLRFRALNPAAELPRLGELSPETWIAPCDEDDVICLQEAAEAERELAAALGELQ